MNWTVLLVIFVIFVAYYTFSRSGLISVKKARGLLKEGALVIDVRSAGEYVAGHLPIAVNLPVNEIESSLSRRVKEKNRVLLVHCQSGMRSAEAKRKLIALGCPNAFNLGSYARALRIVTGK